MRLCVCVCVCVFVTLTRNLRLGSAEAEAWKTHEEAEIRQTEAESSEEKKGAAQERRESRADEAASSSAAKRSPVCVMSAGYITGFINECMSASQGDKARVSQLSALEVGCSALGTQHDTHDTRHTAHGRTLDQQQGTEAVRSSWRCGRT